MFEILEKYYDNIINQYNDFKYLVSELNSFYNKHTKIVNLKANDIDNEPDSNSQKISENALRYFNLIF